MVEECPGLHYELHDFNEYCVAFNRSVHLFFIKKFSDIEIGVTDPFNCSKTCTADFPDITLDMTGESDKKQRGENGRRFRK